MAKIKTSIIKDTLELCNRAGEVEKTIPITINAARIANDVTKLRIDMANAANDPETLGRAAVELFTLLFGADATSEIMSYYNDDYISMISDLTPYIVEEIYPVFDAMREKTLALKMKAKR
jgi:hypothetical protein